MAWIVPSRGATLLLEDVARRRWGYPPRLMAPLVDRLGALGALRWTAWHLASYDRIREYLGETGTHLLCLAVSAINDCDYGTQTYGAALQLAHLRERSRLFPMDEREMAELSGLSPADIRRRLTEASRRAGLHDEIRWLDRAITLALAPDPRPTDPDDARIARLVHMIHVLNEVAVDSGITADEAPTVLNKDQELKNCYNALRAAQTV